MSRGCCGRNSDRELSLSEKRTFLGLIDNGAPAKSFKVLLDMQLDKVHYHIGRIQEYRDYVAIHDEIDAAKVAGDITLLEQLRKRLEDE